MNTDPGKSYLFPFASAGAALAVMACAFAVHADSLAVKMLPDERWWGLCNNFGREMPFTEKSDFSCDLRRDNYSHQSLSLLCSDKGRAIWCAEPVGAKIKDGVIVLESDKGEIVLEDAGRNLGEAFRYASKNWFPPTGEEPELLYFSAPQYNTWIELTYHQNERDILAYAKSMLDHGLPPGVFMIDDTWQHGYGEWYFDARRFPDPKGMMDKLHAMGFKVLLWMCPFVSMDTPAYRRIAFGRNPDDVRGYPMKGGFLTTSREPTYRDRNVPPVATMQWWNGKSALLDFTHPNAVAWFTEQLDRLVRDYGADGFKFDGGSVMFYTGARADSPSGTGLPGLCAHDESASPVAQSALYGNFALKYKGSEYRNVFGFAGKPVIMRLHDKAHSWDALRRLVPDMLAAGFVGCPFICPDMIGGGEWTAFLPGAPFDPELFIRSAQVHALCPMMQISASPWRVLPPEHQRTFREVAALRQKFAPRFVELARASAKTGEPMMRNLEYCFPHMGYAEVKDEFMMGGDLLVAPVLEKGATSRKVVLPPGNWKADDGRTYAGPAAVAVEAPLSRLPHFERLKAAAAAAECALSAPDGDATEMLQKAFSDVGNERVTLGAGDYVVAKTIRIRRSNLEVVLRDGARILAKKGMFRRVTESMVEIAPGAENVVLRGEGSATLEMRLRDYQDKSQGYAPGAWRHVVSVHGARNVKISGLTLARAGGDGLYVSSGARDVVAEDCRFMDNNRLGIAGIDVDGLTVRRCHFEANNGTWPKGGIDLEPNSASQRIKNVLVEDCVFKGHEGCGFVLHVLKLTPKSEPVSVVVRNCRAVDCGQVGYNVTATGEEGPCRGSVLFENCTSVGNRQGDLKEVFMSPDGVQVETRGCDFGRVEVVPWVKHEVAAPFSAQKVKPLVAVTSGGVASTGWLRYGGCFLQPVPGAGRYKVRFDVMKLGKDADPSLKVVVTDSLGTERDTLSIGSEGADYEFETTGPNCFQFRLSPRSCVARVSSRLPGAALRADRFVHVFGKDPKRKYRFLVPGGCEEVRVSVNPEEPMTVALFDADGREASRRRFVKVAGTLAARRAKTERDEIWTLDLTDIAEDGQFKIAAPCPPVAELAR